MLGPGWDGLGIPFPAQVFWNCSLFDSLNPNHNPNANPAPNPKPHPEVPIHIGVRVQKEVRTAKLGPCRDGFAMPFPALVFFFDSFNPNSNPNHNINPNPNSIPKPKAKTKIPI